MSSTNKTTNYELSQFLGSDKPAWLSDYNTDMSKIDTQMKANADAATAAGGKADANTTAIGDLTDLTTTAKTNVVAAVNEVKTEAGTAQGTANAASTNASRALEEIAKFNLTTRATLTATTSRGTISDANTYIRFASDSTASIFKIYGRIQVGDLSGNTGSVTLTMNSALRPSDSYTIEAVGIMASSSDSAFTEYVRPVTMNVATNGVITITTEPLQTNIKTINIILPPCLYFNTNFGD